MPKRPLLASVLLVAAVVAVALLNGDTRRSSRAVPTPPQVPVEQDEGEAVVPWRYDPLHGVTNVLLGR